MERKMFDTNLNHLSISNTIHYNFKFIIIKLLTNNLLFYVTKKYSYHNKLFDYSYNYITANLY